jgi:PhnB protein
MVKAIPEGYHSLTPNIVYKDTRKAIEFYKKALGAKERHIMPGPNGQGVAHAEIQIGNSIIMMCDESAEMKTRSAQTLGGSPVSFYIYLADVDAAFQKALSAGCHALMPPTDQFWGDRMGALADPFGYQWILATHTKDLSEQEIREAAQAAYAAK